MQPIRFKGTESVLSNFHPHWLHEEELGMSYYSVEQAYQHQCAVYNGFDEVADSIMTVSPGTDTGKICKGIAKEKICPKRKSWINVKEDILYDFLLLKLDQYRPFRRTLVATDRPLHHTVASNYWEMGKLGKGQNRFGNMLMKLRQYVKSSWSSPRKQVLVYSDSIFKYLPDQLEEIGFQVHALPGGSIGGRKAIGPFIQSHKVTRKPDLVILHVGTNDLQFLKQHPGSLHSTIDQLVCLAKKLVKKHKEAKVMVSLPLPRLDEYQQMWLWYCHYLTIRLAHEYITSISWEDFPTNHLSMDLVHPTAQEGLSSLHWSLVDKIRATLPTTQPEAKMTTQPEAKMTTQPEAKMTTQPEAKMTTQPEAKMTTQPEAKMTTQPEAKMTTQPEAKMTTQPEAKMTTQPEAKMTTQPEAKMTTQPEAKMTTQPEAKMTTQPEAKMTTKPEAKMTTQPEAKMTTQPEAKMTTQPEAKMTTKPEAKMTTQPEAKMTTQPEAKMTTQPEAKMTTQPEAKMTTQPEAKMTTQPEAKMTTQPEAKMTTKPEAKMTTQPEAKMTTQPEAR